MDLKVTNSTSHYSTTPEISDTNTNTKTKTASANDEQHLAKVARDFETLLTSMMLKSMTSSTEDGLMDEDSFGGDYFNMIFQQEMASKISEGEGLGIAEALFQKLTGKSLKDVDTDVKLNDTEYDPVYNIDNGLPSLQPSNSSLKRLEQYEDIIQDASDQYGVSPNIIKSVILTESAANENAKSSANAKGLMQLIDSTASDMGVNNVWDPRENIMGGTKYLSKMLRQYDGDLKLALAGYNAGPGNVQKYNGVPPFEETQKYITRVMSYMNHLKEGTNEA
jgi:Rod binding domain-containing protein